MRVLLAEGRLPETCQRRSGMRRLRAGLVTSHSGGVGAPPGWPLRAACEELADDRYSRRKRGLTPRQERRSGAPRGEHPDRKGCAADAVKHAQTAQACLLAAVGAPFGAPLPLVVARGGIGRQANPAPFQTIRAAERWL